MKRFFQAAATACLLGQGALADTVLSGHHTINGRLCVGPDCTGSEQTSGENKFKLKGQNLAMLFQDTSVPSGPLFPTTNWRLLANEASQLGHESFSIENYDTGRQIFKLRAGAPEHALTVANNGFVGLGTLYPGRKLHLAQGSEPGIRFEQTGDAGHSPRTWDVSAAGTGFAINDVTAGNTVFRISANAPLNALLISENGNVGFGAFPWAPLYVYRDDGTARMQVHEASDVVQPRTLLSLRNNGRPEIEMSNHTTNGEWSIGAGTNFILKHGTVSSTSAEKTKYFTLKPGSGDLEIAGQIITGGPSCAAGCDAVFSDDYDLPSIAEHAEAMFALGHLPNVGPTRPGAPVNMSEQFGALLNELEHAHIFIDQLNREMQDQRALNARLLLRLERLEAVPEN